MSNLQYWLMKSEPDAYGIDHLRQEGTTLWDGIRNYQARNFMRTMQPGDQAFFYHSNCKPPGIVGLMEVTETQLVDPTQFDPKATYYDPKSSPDKPRWDCAKLRYLGQFQAMLSLDQLRDLYDAEQLPVIKRGNRLSILPVPAETAVDLLERLGPLN
tara:strand:- start:634 stop:1104 length:471 start_codon:yes stop_codon:yes gene_type:complete